MHIKICISFFIVFFVHSSLSKPTMNYLTEGRGIGSTIWGWITYPFSWWSSGEPELPPVNDHLVGPAPYGPYDNIEIAKRNVTVWCNDQTCTTMKCDKFGCKNVTCNIYDTDMKGECREYNTVVKPEEPVPPKPEIATESLEEDKTGTTKAPELISVAPVTSTQTNTNQPIEEHPLELEAVLSSTVQEGNVDKAFPVDKINKSSSPQNKV